MKKRKAPGLGEGDDNERIEALIKFQSGQPLTEREKRILASEKNKKSLPKVANDN